MGYSYLFCIVTTSLSLAVRALSPTVETQSHLPDSNSAGESAHCLAHEQLGVLALTLKPIRSLLGNHFPKIVVLGC